VNADGTGLANLSNSSISEISPAWSPDGSKLVFSSNERGNWQLHVMNADGSGVTNISTPWAPEFYPAWSPDGSKIVYGYDGDLYVRNADGSGRTNINNHADYDLQPAWSPDGSKIAFSRYQNGDYEVYVMNADGTGQVNLSNNAAWDYDPVWSPDGRKLAFASERDGDAEIFVMNADGSGQTRLTNNSSHDVQPEWSPDGRKIAFSSNRDGNWEIYAMNADGSGQVNLSNSPARDTDPTWQPIPAVPPNEAPSMSLKNLVTTLPEDTSTTSALKVADIQITDDGQGTNELSLTGADADLFEIIGTELFLKAGTALEFETNPTLDVTVLVDDPTVGDTPDASAGLNISITNVNKAPTVAAPAVLTAFENVNKTIGGITVGDAEGDDLTVTLTVAHGTLTLGTTTGLTVVGNRSGSVSLYGSSADLNAALAGLVYRGSPNYSGADTLQVQVSDGNQSTSSSVAITVRSAAQQRAELLAQIDALYAARVLTQTQAKFLTSKLNLNDLQAGIRKLQSFLKRVNALREGTLTQAQADALWASGNILLLSMTRG
jgi:hypothetical protein